MTSFYSFECSTQEEMIINKGRLLNDKGESIQVPCGIKTVHSGSAVIGHHIFCIERLTVSGPEILQLDGLWRQKQAQYWIRDAVNAAMENIYI